MTRFHSARTVPAASALAAALLAAAAAHGDSIRLRATGRVPDGAEVVRLSDVADIEGADARRLADVEIAPAPAPGATLEIPVARVRAALDAAGAHWGRVNLSGRVTMVRPSLRAAEAPRVP